MAKGGVTVELDTALLAGGEVVSEGDLGRLDGELGEVTSSSRNSLESEGERMGDAGVRVRSEPLGMSRLAVWKSGSEGRLNSNVSKGWDEKGEVSPARDASGSADPSPPLSLSPLLPPPWPIVSGKSGMLGGTTGLNRAFPSCARAARAAASGDVRKFLVADETVWLPSPQR